MSAAALRAWAQVLRAPLLLSPVADVSAGAFVAAAALPGNGVPAARLLVAVGAGICLLAAGMAANAWFDRDEDRRLKPGRPLPRGAVSERAVLGAALVAWMAGLALARRAGLLPFVAALAIVLVTLVYHVALKRRAVAGALALGSARALDLCLGAGVVFSAGAFEDATVRAAGGLVLRVAALYGLYVTGAALHASTDDRAERSSLSPAGLGLSCAVIAAGLAFALHAAANGGPALHRLAALLLLAWALLRLLRAWRRAPPPVVTGAALSNLYPLGAALVLLSGAAWAAAALILAAFLIGRAALRIVPPS